MNINRNNAEAWFLDFYEGRLSDGQVKELFAFLDLNPDLQEIFDSFEDVSFDPEKQIRFEDKDALKKTVEELPGINNSNYEEYLVGALEGTLTQEEAVSLEIFLAANPAKQKELDLLRKTIFEPEQEIVFEAKASLKKSVLVTEENFAEYAVAYTDGELSGETLQQFEAFVAAHPAMKAELNLFAKTKLQADASIVFEDKASLKRKALVVTAENFDEIAVASIEGQLNSAEEKVFATYLAANAPAEKSFAFYTQTKLQPDTTIIFADKASLKRKDRGAFWWHSSSVRFAAAAAVLLFVVFFAWNRSTVNPKDDHAIVIADNNTPKNNANSGNVILPADTNAVHILTPEKQQANDRFASNTNSRPHTTVTVPAKQLLETPGTISTAVHYLQKKRSNDEPEFSGDYFNAVPSSSPVKNKPDAISPGQFAMRWMKERLDRRPVVGEEDGEDMVAAAQGANNENQEVSGFDVTSSAVNRIGNATGSRLHLGKNAEGTVLSIGKYDIFLSRNH